MQINSNSPYKGTYQYEQSGNVQKQSKLQQVQHAILNAISKPFKMGILPTTSNKQRLSESRKDLKSMGGEVIKLSLPNNAKIDAMYLSANTFKEKIETYFDVKREDEKQYLVLKDEFIDQTKEFSSDSFKHIQKGEAREFCKLLAKLDIGLELNGSHPEINKDAVIIPLRLSNIVQPTEEEKPSPVALICPGDKMSYPEYKGVAAAYLMRGVDVMLFDYPGVGLSKGSSTEYNTKLATDTCFQYLKNMKEKKNSEIIVHGHSGGAVNATDLGARRKGVHVVVDRGFSSFRQILADKKPRISKIAERMIPGIANLNNKANLKNIEGHIAIISGSCDTAIPDSHIDANIRAAEKKQRPEQVIKSMEGDVTHTGNIMSQVAGDFDEFLEEAKLNPGLFDYI